jgi:putative ABC transport system substrate-binding protein
MTSRRAFVFLATAGGLLRAAGSAHAQPARGVHRVGFIAGAAAPSDLIGPQPASPPLKAFLQGMSDLGYVDGRNLLVERRTAEARFERVGGIVADLIRSKVDVIVASGHGTALAAKAATTTVPIVVDTSSTDPVAEGLVRSLARPGGNVTGFTTFVGPELEAKRLKLLIEVLPGVSRIAYLASRENKDWELPRAQSVREAAQSLGITLVPVEHTLREYAGAFASIARDRAQALFVSPSPAALADRAIIADLAIRARLPSSFAFREQVESGGLMSYGVNLADVLRRAAGYVDRILKGAQPAELPVQHPTTFELVVNGKTAEALALTIPQSIRMQADII